MFSVEIREALLKPERYLVSGLRIMKIPRQSSYFEVGDIFHPARPLELGGKRMMSGHKGLSSVSHGCSILVINTDVISEFVTRLVASRCNYLLGTSKVADSHTEMISAPENSASEL